MRVLLPEEQSGSSLGGNAVWVLEVLIAEAAVYWRTGYEKAACKSSVASFPGPASQTIKFTLGIGGLATHG